MSGRRRTACLAAFVVGLLAGTLHPTCAARAATGPAPVDLATKHVLILHAHEAQAPVFGETDRALSETLRAGGLPLANLFFESLDLQRNPDPERDARIESPPTSSRPHLG